MTPAGLGARAFSVDDEAPCSVITSVSLLRGPRSPSHRLEQMVRPLALEHAGCPGDLSCMVESELSIGFVPGSCDRPTSPVLRKKADVSEHPEVFDHFGFLIGGPPTRPGCPSSSHPTTL